MRKFIAVVILLMSLLIIGRPVYAHLTGAFAEFLAVVYDESTVDDLKQELDDTKDQIAIITPKVDQLEKEFTKKQTLAIDQLIGYSDVGLDTWYTMLADDADVVDLLGDQWVMKKAINNYMTSLNDLYLLYDEVKTEQDTLKGHKDLLKMIDKSIKRRARYMAENEGLAFENIANYLDIDWFSEVEKPIIKAMNDDKKNVNEKLKSLVVKKGEHYVLQEATLNKMSKATYFLRADHVYVEFEVNDEQVILIGQVLQNKAGTKANLVFEAGYYNGFLLPNEDLIEIPSISFSYETLRQLAGITSPYLTQQNGSIQVNSK